MKIVRAEPELCPRRLLAEDLRNLCNIFRMKSDHIIKPLLLVFPGDFGNGGNGRQIHLLRETGAPGFIHSSCMGLKIPDCNFDFRIRSAPFPDRIPQIGFKQLFRVVELIPVRRIMDMFSFGIHIRGGFFPVLLQRLSGILIRKHDIVPAEHDAVPVGGIRLFID